MRRPRFDSDEFTRELQRTIDEVRQSRDDTDEIAEEAFLHELFPGHPFGRCAVGSVRALERIRVEDVRSFHEKSWPARGGVLVVVGDVDAQAFLDRLATALGDWSTGVPEAALPPVPKQVTGLYHAGSVGIIMSGWLGAMNYGRMVAGDVDNLLATNASRSTAEVGS